MHCIRKSKRSEHSRDGLVPKSLGMTYNNLATSGDFSNASFYSLIVDMGPNSTEGNGLIASIDLILETNFGKAAIFSPACLDFNSMLEKFSLK